MVIKQSVLYCQVAVFLGLCTRIFRASARVTWERKNFPQVGNLVHKICELKLETILVDHFMSSVQK